MSFLASLPEPDYEFIRDNEGVKRVLPSIEASSLLSVDTETTGLDPITSTVLLIQIGVSDNGIHKAFVFDAQKIDVQLLKPVLESTTPKILQNAKFDYKMLFANYGIDINQIFCTLLAERVLTTGIIPRPKMNLAALAEKYLSVNLPKETRKGFVDRGAYRDAFTEKELWYAANDTLVLFPIFQAQMSELQDVDLLQTALLEFIIIPAISQMELNGCRIDQDKWRDIISLIKHDRDVLSKEILFDLDGVVPQNDLFGLPMVNLGSHPQVLKALLAMNVVMPDGKAIEGTGEEILATCQKKFPICAKLLSYRGLEKLVSAYGESFLNKIHKTTHRLHANFNQLRADTGRMSSSKPNLQQVPIFFAPENFELWQLEPDYKATYFWIDEKRERKRIVHSDLRSCFIPRAGYKLVTADYSQQELRVLADASGDAMLMEAYQNNEDVHTKTGSVVYGIPLDKVSSKQRKVAKVLNFALIYGAGAWKIAGSLGIDETAAQKLIDKYFEGYSGVRGFMKKIADFAIRYGYSQTVSGRRRYYKLPTPSDITYKKDMGRIRRQAPNHFIQGSSADVTKQAICNTHRFIASSGMDIKMLMVVHDEIVLEVLEEHAEASARGLESAMIEGFTHYFSNVPMLVDASIADFWSKG